MLKGYPPGATMPIARKAVTLRGSCHCGQLRIEFSTDQDPASIVPRSCDCSFCQKHGAEYISDPAGRLSVSQSHSGTLREYRQGSNAAQFLICGHCGVLVAVIFRHNSRIYGAANAGCLDGHTGLASPAPASPQTLSPEEKVSRWLKLWVPDVVLATSGETGISSPRPVAQCHCRFVASLQIRRQCSGHSFKGGSASCKRPPDRRFGGSQ